MSMDLKPFSIESFPREGPTVLSSMILTGAGRAPALRTMARSRASSVVKRPVIWAFPPDILSWITGAELTFLSSTMASLFFIFCPVSCSKSLAPLASNERET